MKKPAFLKENGGSKIALQGGSYSLAVTAIVLAILVAVNVLVSVLPTSATRYDISATKLYSITSNTKAVISGLTEDVTIYWIVQADQEDEVISNLLDKYESLSDHITVVKKNPDVYPTFAAQYTDETVYNNSLVEECGSKSRYIAYDDIYLQEVDYTTYSYATSFDGEGAITSAIDYVVSDELPQLYVLEGHGEAELSAVFSDQLTKENVEVNTFSLLTENAVPDAADCVLIYAPESDISEEERDILADYVSTGGKLLMLAGPTEDGTLTNLYSLLANYGVTAAEGIVVEGDSSHYAFGYPHILLPDMADSEITQSLTAENYYAIIPIAQGMTISDSATNVTALLTTSDASFSKAAGYQLSTYEKEDGDTDGPFAVAVSVADSSGGEIVWFGSSLMLEEGYNDYSSGGNLDMVMNALSDLVGEREAIAIRSKSLDYNYLTISESTASLLKTVMIGVIPIAFAAVGIYVVAKRRMKRHG